MAKDKKDRPLLVRISIDIAGFSLIITSIVFGWLPGPGGIPLFLAGLGLVALNHEWAENLLKNFDKKRTELTDKYLMTSPRVSLAIDITCLLLMITGVFIALTQTQLLYRGVGIAATSISLIIILSNQKRFERIAQSFKKH